MLDVSFLRIASPFCPGFRDPIGDAGVHILCPKSPGIFYLGERFRMTIRNLDCTQATVGNCHLTARLWNVFKLSRRW